MSAVNDLAVGKDDERFSDPRLTDIVDERLPRRPVLEGRRPHPARLVVGQPLDRPRLNLRVDRAGEERERVVIRCVTDARRALTPHDAARAFSPPSRKLVSICPSA